MYRNVVKCNRTLAVEKVKLTTASSLGDDVRTIANDARSSAFSDLCVQRARVELETFNVPSVYRSSGRATDRRTTSWVAIGTATRREVTRLRATTTMGGAMTTPRTHPGISARLRRRRRSNTSLVRLESKRAREQSYCETNTEGAKRRRGRDAREAWNETALGARVRMVAGTARVGVAGMR